MGNLVVLKAVFNSFLQVFIKESFGNLFIIALVSLEIAKRREGADRENHRPSPFDGSVFNFGVNPNLRGNYILGISAA